MASRHPLGPLGDRGPDAREAVWVLAALTALEAAAVALSPRWVGPTASEALAFTGILRLADVGLLLAYWWARNWRLADLGLLGPRVWAGLSVGMLWSAACAAVVAAAEVGVRLAVGESPLRLLSAGSLRWGHAALLFTVGGAVGPVFEEFAFRGVLYGGLRKRFGAGAATAGASLLFALAHAVTTRVPVVQAVGGILFCLAYEASGSLWAPLILHISANVAIFSLPYLLPLFGP